MQCASCGKQAVLGEQFYLVMRRLSSGKSEQIAVCNQCEPSVQGRKYPFEIEDFPTSTFEIGEKIYTYEERPPFWRNEVPLPRLLDRKLFPLEDQLPLQAFPLIEDFEVILEGRRANDQQKAPLPPSYFVMLFSPSRGYLASRAGIYDTPQDLCRSNFIIPHGDSDAPYDELEQNWNMLIVEDQAFVYIMTGNWEEHEEHHTWFKVERSLYYRRREKAIQHCRALCLSEA